MAAFDWRTARVQTECVVSAEGIVDFGGGVLADKDFRGQMKIFHIVPGLDDPTCGIAVAAKMVARRQSKDSNAVECVGYRDWMKAQIGEADEVWVHSMWTPGVMKAAWAALRMGRTLVRMPHGCMDPVKVRHHWWKKIWVMPFEKWLFARATQIVATCPDEVDWVRKFVPGVMRIDLMSLGDGATGKPLEKTHNPLRLLFVGRLHPLKGVEYLIRALHELNHEIHETHEKGSGVVLKIIGKDEGEGEKLRQLEEEKEKAWDWCDVLVLPTLSENFGLVVAEALERGKRVITTDGAPVWNPGDRGQELGVSVGCDGRLLYLNGYRDGTRGMRVELLKKAIEGLGGSR